MPENPAQRVVIQVKGPDRNGRWRAWETAAPCDYFVAHCDHAAALLLCVSVLARMGVQVVQRFDNGREVPLDAERYRCVSDLPLASERGEPK